MTQAELWQLQLFAVSNSIDRVWGLLTVLTGYLVAAYFVRQSPKPLSGGLGFDRSSSSVQDSAHS